MMPINKATSKFITSEGYFVLRVVIAFIFFSLAVIPFVGSKFDMKRLNIYGILFTIIFYWAIYYSLRINYGLRKINQAITSHWQQSKLKDNTTIYTNDSLILIGKTNSYVFLYKFTSIADSSFTRIVPMDQIKYINIIKYGSWYRLP
jgi:Ca2+/Na+ antiporter